MFDSIYTFVRRSVPMLLFSHMSRFKLIAAAAPRVTDEQVQGANMVFVMLDGSLLPKMSSYAQQFWTNMVEEVP